MPRRRRPLRLVALALALLVVTGVARLWWLAREDTFIACPVMAVLNGDYPARADEAARLRGNGYLADVWLTNDPKSGAPHTPDAGTDSNVRRLVEHGVPRAAIHVLPGAATGTRAELGIIRLEAERLGLPCVVVVTSPWHGARVKASWEPRGRAMPRLVVRHAAEPGYTGWRVASRELAGAGAALLGLPR